MDKREYIERNAVLEIVKRTSGDYAAAFAEIRALPTADEQEVMACAEANLKYANDSLEILRQIHGKVSTPAADVVEVVRCKDCKNAYINSFSAQSGIAVCRFLANRSNGELAIVQQDDFCSYGERKEATP